MSQASNIDHDFSNLEENLLKMWIPVTGARTASELWIKNFQKFASSILNPDLASRLIRRLIVKRRLPIFQHDRDFECYFDAQSPFQLKEAILTGSFNEGLFLYSSERPDMDFMCELKNIMFSQRDLENGSLSLREHTPFVYAYVGNEGMQKLWSEFLDDSAKEEGKHRLCARKVKEKLSENFKKMGRRKTDMFGVEQLEEVTEGAAITIVKSEPTHSYRDCLVDFVKKILRQPVNQPLDLGKEYMQSIGNLPDFLYDKLVLSSDIVLCIFCEGWPSCAREWITRGRLWPDMESVNKIARNGFHIVPKSSSDGDFRLSFSCAESMLIQTLS